jgi:hypothetical protein
LTRTQIEEIFLGKVGRFPDGSIAVPLDLIEGSSGRDVFYAKLGKSPSQLKAYWSKIIFTGRGQPPRTVANGTEMKKRVAENPDAIGYIDAKLVDDTVRVLF